VHNNGGQDGSGVQGVRTHDGEATDDDIWGSLMQVPDASASHLNHIMHARGSELNPNAADNILHTGFGDTNRVTSHESTFGSPPSGVSSVFAALSTGSDDVPFPRTKRVQTVSSVASGAGQPQRLQQPHPQHQEQPQLHYLQQAQQVMHVQQQTHAAAPQNVSPQSLQNVMIVQPPLEIVQQLLQSQPQLQAMMLAATQGQAPLFAIPLTTAGQALSSTIVPGVTAPQAFQTSAATTLPSPVGMNLVTFPPHVSSLEGTALSRQSSLSSTKSAQWEAMEVDLAAEAEDEISHVEQTLRYQDQTSAKNEVEDCSYSIGGARLEPTNARQVEEDETPVESHTLFFVTDDTAPTLELLFRQCIDTEGLRFFILTAYPVRTKTRFLGYARFEGLESQSSLRLKWNRPGLIVKSGKPFLRSDFTREFIKRPRRHDLYLYIHPASTQQERQQYLGCLRGGLDIMYYVASGEGSNCQIERRVLALTSQGVALVPDESFATQPPAASTRSPINAAHSSAAAAESAVQLPADQILSSAMPSQSLAESVQSLAEVNQLPVELDQLPAQSAQPSVVSIERSSKSRQMLVESHISSCGSAQASCGTGVPSHHRADFDQMSTQSRAERAEKIRSPVRSDASLQRSLDDANPPEYHLQRVLIENQARHEAPLFEFTYHSVKYAVQFGRSVDNGVATIVCEALQSEVILQDALSKFFAVPHSDVSDIVAQARHSVATRVPAAAESHCDEDGGIPDLEPEYAKSNTLPSDLSGGPLSDKSFEELPDLSPAWEPDKPSDEELSVVHLEVTDGMNALEHPIDQSDLQAIEDQMTTASMSVSEPIVALLDDFFDSTGSTTTDDPIQIDLSTSQSTPDDARVSSPGVSDVTSTNNVADLQLSHSVQSHSDTLRKQCPTPVIPRIDEPVNKIVTEYRSESRSAGRALTTTSSSSGSTSAPSSERNYGYSDFNRLFGAAHNYRQELRDIVLGWSLSRIPKDIKFDPKFMKRITSPDGKVSRPLLKRITHFGNADLHREFFMQLLLLNFHAELLKEYELQVRTEGCFKPYKVAEILDPTYKAPVVSASQGEGDTTGANTTNKTGMTGPSAAKPSSAFSKLSSESPFIRIALEKLERAAGTILHNVVSCERHTKMQDAIILKIERLRRKLSQDGSHLEYVPVPFDWWRRDGSVDDQFVFITTTATPPTEPINVLPHRDYTAAGREGQLSTSASGVGSNDTTASQFIGGSLSHTHYDCVPYIHLIGYASKPAHPSSNTLTILIKHPDVVSGLTVYKNISQSKYVTPEAKVTARMTRYVKPQTNLARFIGTLMLAAQDRAESGIATSGLPTWRYLDLRCLPLGSLTTVSREYSALKIIGSCPLAKHIFMPTPLSEESYNTMLAKLRARPDLTAVVRASSKNLVLPPDVAMACKELQSIGVAEVHAPDSNTIHKFLEWGKHEPSRFSSLVASTGADLDDSNGDSIAPTPVADSSTRSSLSPAFTWVGAIIQIPPSQEELSQSLWEHVPPTLLNRIQSSFNPSQMRALQHAIVGATQGGFVLLQGPPGTGKTKTVCTLLNVLNVTRFQKFYADHLRYEQILILRGALMRFITIDASDMLPLGSSPEAIAAAQDVPADSCKTYLSPKQNEMIEEIAAFLGIDRATRTKVQERISSLRRPRALVCAPSNAGVDEIIQRLLKTGMVDGANNPYRPQMIRIGYNDKKVRSGVWSAVSLQERFASKLIDSFPRVVQALNDARARLDRSMKAYEYQQAKMMERHLSVFSREFVDANGQVIRRLELLSGFIRLMKETTSGSGTTEHSNLHRAVWKGFTIEDLSSLAAILEEVRFHREEYNQYKLVFALYKDMEGVLQQHVAKLGGPAAIEKKVAAMVTASQERNVGNATPTAPSQVSAPLFRVDNPHPASLLSACSLDRLYNHPTAQHLRRAIVRDATIIFSTLSGADELTRIFALDEDASRRVANGDDASENGADYFDDVIIDEAGQCSEATALVALAHASNHCILVGDPKQLPATVHIYDSVRSGNARVPQRGPMELPSDIPYPIEGFSKSEKPKLSSADYWGCDQSRAGDGSTVAQQGADKHDDQAAPQEVKYPPESHPVFQKLAPEDEATLALPAGIMRVAERSLFERLQDAGHPVLMLTTQYRMHPQIRAFPSNRFYRGLLSDGPDQMHLGQMTPDVFADSRGVALRGGDPTRCPPWYFNPYLRPFVYFDTFESALSGAFIDPCDLAGALRMPPHSMLKRPWFSRADSVYVNTLEIVMIIWLILHLASIHAISPEDEIGIITYYSEQSSHAKNLVREVVNQLKAAQAHEEFAQIMHRIQRARQCLERVEVSTVDGYQGREGKVIFISTSRLRQLTPLLRRSLTLKRDYYANKNALSSVGPCGSIGFVKDPRRMNVALTRAKLNLFVFGDSSLLASGSPNWKGLRKYALENDALLLFNSNDIQSGGTRRPLLRVVDNQDHRDQPLPQHPNYYPKSRSGSPLQNILDSEQQNKPDKCEVPDSKSRNEPHIVSDKSDQKKSLVAESTKDGSQQAPQRPEALQTTHYKVHKQQGQRQEQDEQVAEQTGGIEAHPKPPKKPPQPLEQSHHTQEEAFQQEHSHQKSASHPPPKHQQQHPHQSQKPLHPQKQHSEAPPTGQDAQTVQTAQAMPQMSEQQSARQSQGATSTVPQSQARSQVADHQKSQQSSPQEQPTDEKTAESRPIWNQAEHKGVQDRHRDPLSERISESSRAHSRERLREDYWDDYRSSHPYHDTSDWRRAPGGDRSRSRRGYGPRSDHRDYRQESVSRDSRTDAKMDARVGSRDHGEYRSEYRHDSREYGPDYRDYRSDYREYRRSHREYSSSRDQDNRSDYVSSGADYRDHRSHTRAEVHDPRDYRSLDLRSDERAGTSDARYARGYRPPSGDYYDSRSGRRYDGSGDGDGASSASSSYHAYRM